jgi:hypothetical protein
VPDKVNLKGVPKVILHIDNRMEVNPPINPKTAWWLQHKDDPEFITSMRQARRKYYYKNREQEQARGRENYYKKKALLATPAVVPEAPAE